MVLKLVSYIINLMANSKTQKQPVMTLLVFALVVIGLLLAFQNRSLTNQIVAEREDTPNEIREQIVLATVKQLPEVTSYIKLVNEKGYNVAFDVKGTVETPGMPINFKQGTTLYEVWVYESRDDYLTRFNTYLVPIDSYVVESESILKMGVGGEWIVL